LIGPEQVFDILGSVYNLSIGTFGNEPVVILVVDDFSSSASHGVWVEQELLEMRQFLYTYGGITTRLKSFG